MKLGTAISSYQLEMSLTYDVNTEQIKLIHTCMAASWLVSR